jgi:integrase
MTFLVDVQELKPGLVLFRRGDVKHKNWYCRIRVVSEDRYKTVSLKTPDINEAKDKAFDHDADIRFRIKHEVPIFDKTFPQDAEEYSDHLKAVAETGQITMNRWKIVDSYIRLHLNP